MLRSPSSAGRLDRQLSHPGPVVIVAPFGSGKSQLASDLIHSGKDPGLVVDLRTKDAEIDHVTDNPRHAWLIICHQLDERLYDGNLADLKVVERSDLWFTEPEVKEILLTHTKIKAAASAAAQSIHVATLGWPLAVEMIIQVLTSAPSRSRDVSRVISGGPHIDRLFQMTQRSLGEEAGRYLPILSKFKQLSARVLDSIAGSGSLAMLSTAGLPLVEQSDFTLVLPPILRGRGDATQSPHTVTNQGELADAMIELLGMSDSIRMLCDLDLPHVAVDLVSEAESRRRGFEAPSERVSSIRYLLERVGPTPAVLVELGKAYQTSERRHQAAEAFLEAETLARTTGDEYQRLRARIARCVLELVC